MMKSGLGEKRPMIYTGMVKEVENTGTRMRGIEIELALGEIETTEQGMRGIIEEKNIVVVTGARERMLGMKRGVEMMQVTEIVDIGENTNRKMLIIWVIKTRVTIEIPKRIVVMILSKIKRLIPKPILVDMIPEMRQIAESAPTLKVGREEMKNKRLIPKPILVDMIPEMSQTAESAPTLKVGREENNKTMERRQ